MKFSSNFFPNILLESKQCNHTIVLSQLLLGRIPIAEIRFSSNLSIRIHALLMHMLTSLLVDEILLPRYTNWSTDFRDLPFNEEIAPPYLKHGLCFIWVHVEISASCCLLQTMQQRFGLSRCMQEALGHLCSLYHIFHLISFSSCLFYVKQYSIIRFIDVCSI